MVEVAYLNFSRTLAFMLLSVFFLQASSRARGQSFFDTSIPLNRGAYRNALSLISDVHAYALKRGSSSAAEYDNLLCSSIGISVSELNVLLQEQDMLRMDISQARSRLGSLGAQPGSSRDPGSQFVAAETAALNNSQARLATRMSLAGLHSFQRYLTEDILPATHYYSSGSKLSGGGPR